jgi:DNA-binding transcriptional regulator YiaG
LRPSSHHITHQKIPEKSTAHLTLPNAKISPLFDNLENEQLLTAEELAERLNIAVKTVRKWRYESVLPPDSMVKLRHQVRYRWGKVLGWLITKG